MSSVETLIHRIDQELATEVERQKADLKELIKDQLVEDPVARIRFPKYLASSTLERDGRTYYFVGEDTRREFEKELAAKH